jgi:hypothetical protein
MAKNALYILQDDEILKKFKANALEQAKKFNIHQILPMYENYYVKVLEQASAKINEAHNFSTSI